MCKRSQVPAGVKRGKGKLPKGKGTDCPMNFQRAKARAKRPDTGKKLNKRHHTPNLKTW